MTFLTLIIVYSLMIFGCSQMFIYFDGPFDIIEKWRQLTYRISPKFNKLFTCIFCFSTWVGLAMSMVNYFFVPFAFTPFNFILGGTGLWWLIFPLDMFFGCGVVWLLHQLDEYLGAKAEEREGNGE